MAEITVAVIGTAAGLLFGSYQMKRWNVWERKNGAILVLGTLVLFLAGGYLMRVYEYHILKMLRYWILMYGLLLLALYDVKERVIPNRALLVMAGIRTILLGVECICFPALISEILISAAVGLIGGGFLFLLAEIISRKGIGMGDVKMIAVVGYFLGFRVLMSNLIITMTLTLLGGGILLLAKKASLKTEIPFAPFAAAGTCLTILIGV